MKIKVVRKVDYIEYTKVFKAFCDEQKLQILSMLHRHERCACDLLDELTISQPCPII